MWLICTCTFLHKIQLNKRHSSYQSNLLHGLAFIPIKLKPACVEYALLQEALHFQPLINSLTFNKNWQSIIKASQAMFHMQCPQPWFYLGNKL